MKFAGIIAEYDPFHNGHAWQLAQARALGAQRVAVAMSCGLTQRGALPLLPEAVRVQAALACGADLVFALPAPCACAGAEAFARAGVRILAAAGCDALIFGAETPDTALLQKAARVLCSEEYRTALRQQLAAGARSFAAARQAAVQALCPAGVEFIASHPMAGRETSSVEHAAEVSFAPANFIITPTEKNTPEAVQWAKELAEVLGFRHICTLTVQEHDKMIGYVSQLCHAIAVSLMCANDNSSLCEYTGDSFRDLTRIARINEKMWAELFLWNKENLIAEIAQFDSALDQLRDALVADDRDKLEEMFRLSTQRRAAFDKKDS